MTSPVRQTYMSCTVYSLIFLRQRKVCRFVFPNTEMFLVSAIREIRSVFVKGEIVGE